MNIKDSTAWEKNDSMNLLKILLRGENLGISCK